MTFLERLQKAIGFAPARTLQQIEEAERITNKYFAALSYLGRGPIWNDDNVQNYVEQGYARNPDVFAVVSAIAQKTAALDVKLIENVNGEKVELDHPALDLIYEPNEEQSKFDFIEQLAGYLLITGNAYDYCTSPADGPNAGRPINMYVLPSQFMDVVGGDMGTPVAGYTMSLWGNVEGAEFTTDEIIHFKNAQYIYGDGQERYGMSPIRSAWRSIETGNSGYEANKKGLENLGPPGVLYDKGIGDLSADTLTEVQQRNLESKFRKMSGTKNSGTIAVTSGNLGYINFGLSAVDLAIMDTLKMTLVDVCNVYHVPSQLFNSEIGKTYSNLKEARKQMYTDAVLPMADRIYGKLSRKLLPKYPDLKGRDVYFKVDQSNINELQPDMQELANWLNVSYWLTPNEAREKMGYEREADPMMDEIYMPAGRVPISLSGLDAPQIAEQINGDSLPND